MTSPASGDSSTPSFRRRRRLCILDNPIDFCDIAAYNQWRLEDIVRAGKLLHQPPLPVQFDDEYEMRKVYSMIYDVYRCRYYSLLSWQEEGLPSSGCIQLLQCIPKISILMKTARCVVLLLVATKTTSAY